VTELVPGALRAAGSVRLTSAGRQLLVSALDGKLEVRTGKGEPLDPATADVVIALGGSEPQWLRVVEGLQAAYERGRCRLEDLAPAADALGRRAAERPAIARTTDDPLVLLAFAGAGEHRVAVNPHCTNELWDLLVGHRDPDVVAKTQRVAEILPPQMAFHPDDGVRARVARNPDCPPDLLRELAKLGGRFALQAVASNPHTPADALLELSASEIDVQRVVARNLATPPVALRRLARHDDVGVRSAVARNPSTPLRRTYVMMICRDGAVHSALAQRADIGPRCLSWIERYARRANSWQYRSTRWLIAQHPAATPKLQRRLDRIAIGRDAQKPLGPRTLRNGWHRGVTLWLPPLAPELWFFAAALICAAVLTLINPAVGLTLLAVIALFVAFRLTLPSFRLAVPGAKQARGIIARRAWAIAALSIFVIRAIAGTSSGNDSSNSVPPPSMPGFVNISNAYLLLRSDGNAVYDELKEAPTSATLAQDETAADNLAAALAGETVVLRSNADPRTEMVAESFDKLSTLLRKLARSHDVASFVGLEPNVSHAFDDAEDQARRALFNQ
jgi:hypothetical protein